MSDRTPSILLIGGSGNAGLHFAACMLLLQPEASITLAARGRDRLDRGVDTLRQAHPEARLETLQLDVTNADALTEALPAFDLCVAAASTTSSAGPVAEACIAADCAYLDLQLGMAEKHAALEALRPRIEDAGLSFVTDGGFHPGLPGALVRYADRQIGPLIDAHIYCALRINWRKLHFAPETIAEFAEEMLDFEMIDFREGSWQKLPWRKTPIHDFGALGKLRCLPMRMAELDRLPASMPKLRELGFYMSGFNPLADNLFLPVAMGLAGLGKAAGRFKMFRGAAAGLQALAGKTLLTGLRCGSAPFGVQVIGEFRAEKQSMKLQIGDTDGYRLTAAPAASCAAQLLEGLIPPGLHLQALALDPMRLIADLRVLGFEVGETPYIRQAH